MSLKEDEIMDFLYTRVFDPVLESPHASDRLKQGIRLTVTRMRQHKAPAMVQYYWSAITGTERSIRFSRMMKTESFTRFEETIDEFREKFTDDWLAS